VCYRPSAAPLPPCHSAGRGWRGGGFLSGDFRGRPEYLALWYLVESGKVPGSEGVSVRANKAFPKIRFAFFESGQGLVKEFSVGYVHALGIHQCPNDSGHIFSWDFSGPKDPSHFQHCKGGYNKALPLARGLHQLFCQKMLVGIVSQGASDKDVRVNADGMHYPNLPRLPESLRLHQWAQ